MVVFSRILEEYYQDSGQRVNLFKYDVMFNPKMKIHFRHPIRQRLGVVEQDGLWHYLVFPSLIRS